MDWPIATPLETSWGAGVWLSFIVRATSGMGGLSRLKCCALRLQPRFYPLGFLSTFNSLLAPARADARFGHIVERAAARSRAFVV